MKLKNRVKDTKSFTKNKTIMEMAVEYAKEIEEAYEIVAPINQV